MKPIELSVRCTREEYTQFAAESGKHYPWITGVGAAVFAVGMTAAVMAGRVDRLALLLLFSGVLLLLTDTLLLPMLRKGEAAARYDRSDSLQGAVAVRIEEHTVFVRSVSTEATLPFTAMTAVTKTDKMLALCFGEELTVFIPLRALHEEEKAALNACFTQFSKEETTL